MAVVKAGAEDGDKDKDNVYSGLGLKTSRRSLSVQQRWRAFQFHMKEQREKLATLPPMLQLFNLMAALRKYIKPVLDAVEKCKATWENMGEMYEQYLAEETRSRWTWEKKNRKELELFGRIPPYIFGVACTLAYQVFVPVSLFMAIILPLYYAWVLWDQWWLSPIVVGMVLISPLKFPLTGATIQNFCLIWPGLI